MYKNSIHFNTEPILLEIENVIKNGLTSLLSQHLDRYELLERTHEAIMNLPSIKNEFKPEYTTHNISVQEKSHEEHGSDLRSIMSFTEELVKNEIDKKYTPIIPLLEKMMTKIENLTNEVNELKSKNSKNICDLTYEEVQIKIEPVEKENIKLEIEENNEEEVNDADEMEDGILSESEDDILSQSEDDILSQSEDDILSQSEDDILSQSEDDILSKSEDDTQIQLESQEEEEDTELISSDNVDEEVLEEDVEVVEKIIDEDEVETEKSDSEDEVQDELQDEVQEAEEEEYFEIDIDDITYCTNDEENGFIYELSEDGDIGTKVGYLKDGEPFFYADEK
jgi:hypothetical protein